MVRQPFRVLALLILAGIFTTQSALVGDGI